MMTSGAESESPNGAETPGKGGEGPLYPLSSVVNALNVLEMLRISPVIRVTDVATELGLARSTAHRILTMLQHRGFVRQDPETKLYSAGNALLVIGLRAWGEHDIQEIAQRHLPRLRDVTGETCSLVVLEGRETVLVSVIEGLRPLRVVERVGTREAADATSAGRAILAEMSAAELQRIYSNDDLQASRGPGLSTRHELDAVLRDVRARGYATTLRDPRRDVVAVSAAIRDRHGVVRGAVSLALPASRIEDDTESVFGQHVVSAARAIGADVP